MSELLWVKFNISVFLSLCLLMQVSRLLSTIFVVSVSAESISLPLCTGKALSASHWAAYFHQASVGSYMHYQYLSSMKGNNESGNSKASKVCYHVLLENLF